MTITEERKQELDQMSSRIFDLLMLAFHEGIRTGGSTTQICDFIKRGADKIASAIGPRDNFNRPITATNERNENDKESNDQESCSKEDSR